MNTRLFFLILIFVFSLSSCTQFWFDGIKNEADELVIQYYSHSSNEPEPVPVSIVSKTSIQKISAFMLNEEPMKKDCSYDGVLQYRSKGKTLLDVEFCISDSCAYAAYVLNSKINYRKLSADGLNYLRSLNAH